MVVFGVNVVNTQRVRALVIDINERLKNPNMVYNPFYGELKLYGETLIINMRPVYPNITIMTIPAFVLGYVFSGWKIGPWCLMVVPFLVFGAFYSRYFIYLVFKKALNKCKYNHPEKLKLLKDGETIERLIKYVSS